MEKVAINKEIKVFMCRGSVETSVKENSNRANEKKVNINEMDIQEEDITR
jgi:hypothetical protein